MLDNVFHSNEYPQLELHVRGNLDPQLKTRANKLTDIVAKALKLQRKGDYLVLSTQKSYFEAAHPQFE